jgi:hypothetical protein
MARTTSRAERYSSKIKGYDHAAHGLAPAPVLDLYETDHPTPQVHDPQFRLTGRTHRGKRGRSDPLTATRTCRHRGAGGLSAARLAPDGYGRSSALMARRSSIAW